MYFQFGHGLCEQEEDACPSKATSIWELPAPLQREHQRGGHHLQLGRTHRWKYVNDCLNVKEKKKIKKYTPDRSHFWGGSPGYEWDWSRLFYPLSSPFTLPSLYAVHLENSTKAKLIWPSEILSLSSFGPTIITPVLLVFSIKKKIVSLLTFISCSSSTFFNCKSQTVQMLSQAR